MDATSDTSVIEELAQYHPLIIEGMGGYDPRDPEPVARQIVSKLRERWQLQPLAKPVILITQGDPLEERGSSAITRASSWSQLRRGVAATVVVVPEELRRRGNLCSDL
mgnify:CR=1 FL=1